MSFKKVISSKDYLNFRFPEAIQVSNKFVVWVERKPDPLNQTYKSHINVLYKKDGTIRKFTSGAKMDNTPKISPDETKLAFISNRNSTSQIFVMHFDGGESEQKTFLESSISNIVWSPDSTKIAFLSKIDPEDPKILERKTFDTKFEKDMHKAHKEEFERQKIEPKVLNKLVYRTGTSYLDLHKYDHIFIYNFENDEVRQISDGEFNYSEICWNGVEILYSITKRDYPDYLSKKATLVKFQINEKRKGIDVHEFFNPDHLGFQAPRISVKGDFLVKSYNKEILPGQNEKWLLITNDGPQDLINSGLDRSFSSIKWLDDNDVIGIVEDSGLATIMVYSKLEKTFTQLTELPTSVVSFDAIDKNEFYFVGTDPKHPFAVWKWNSQDGVTLIDDPNSQYLSEIEISIPEEFWLTNPEGVKYQGWFFEAKSDNGNKPPLILSIHGGPYVMWNNAGTMWHEWQLSVSAGYSVLAINPIGSGGYGEEFAQLIISKWGDNDARDLLLAVDHFKDRINWDRLYITGGSYAGFQTANIIAKDHRFKAACSQRGVYNNLSFYSATDIPVWAVQQFEVDHQTMDYDLKHLWDHSPTSRAKDIETPLLIIHSENDYRVQISQAEELFGALKIQNKEAVLVRYPRDGHELSRSGEPLQLIDRLDKMIQWFEDHK